MAGKAVTKAKKSEVQEFDPGMFEADAGSGNENMTQDDLALPFLKILSGLDPLLDDDNFDGRKGFALPVKSIVFYDAFQPHVPAVPAAFAVFFAD